MIVLWLKKTFKILNAQYFTILISCFIYKSMKTKTEYNFNDLCDNNTF